MPHNRSPKDTPVTSLWNKLPLWKSATQLTLQLPQGKAHLSYLSNKTTQIDVCWRYALKEVKMEASELEEYVDYLECNVDARSEVMETRWIAALEEQRIELQTKREHLENRSSCNNISVRGVLRGAEGKDIMKFMMELLQMIQGEDDSPA
ncbi:hypothetical protein NDU88_000464 [Pleurodeles waltl]|uniref:Uncharacterized protein n=1 Tax=Pleurodeles waltl TaxID=8319 RepID=A0AAV7UQ18_PLEWA|nr:hypothetical protein NDU88_000464 [Pleurodeles waltl]